ncbi:MAG: sigma-70 family RNA polymerase sigma factor [Candidatus Poribacteria bacterium]|nr:sigma-70 family RNA polymerase sigma factor [Candidatus Poribacteria bacterium]
MIPDDVYVHQTVEGDVEAFNELVNRHHSKIYGLAYRMLGNPDDAADATQETFLEAYKSIKTFLFQSQFGTWLYRIGINTCQQYIRKSQSNERKLTAYTREAEIHGPASENDSPERVAIKTEQNEVVQDAIGQLPPKQREVVTLYYMQHMKYREIAEILKCSEGTVASRLNQALKNLKRKLSKYYLQGGVSQ